ncbi:uncharacterized protein LOC113281802 [Papaver somniferum]|uniref:uncharacterized protein LOC113281802 n=1 Tax=Papaver somniferum TaxID=3469 RepID=UPI000E6FAFAD|nr:uncharacterized protein LOC113281802 [Papaver somniferum]
MSSLLMAFSSAKLSRTCRNSVGFRVTESGFPSFLPKEVEKIKDPYAIKLAQRIERLPVKISFAENSILSSCVKPSVQNEKHPLVLLHGFDSSCLEWRYTYPLLEEAGMETWAVDILGWGFSDLSIRPPCNVTSKREHLFQLWKSYIRRPMILVGPSLGAAVAIDFALNHPEAVEKLVLIGASVHTEGTGKLSTLPKIIAYAGVSLLKSVPLRLYANYLGFSGISFNSAVDWTSIGRLHCLLPWWEDATVDFMISGGYNVCQQIQQIKQETLIIWGENDQIISNTLAMRLNTELQNSTLHQIPNAGHLPHVEKPDSISELIVNFVQEGCGSVLGKIGLSFALSLHQ